MIINTGQRTDIPAFYSEWFMNRIREGYVMVRNPFYPEQVTRYSLDPAVVDVLAFCTKDPSPMIPYLDEISPFRQFWFVTITPYGRDIEENVPPKERVMDAFRRVSEKVGPKAMSWRYDPIFISEKYPIEFHIEAFEKMAAELEGYTGQAVVSFIDLYEKTKKNFPEAGQVTRDEEEKLAAAIAGSGRRHGMTIRGCYERQALAEFGWDMAGCMTKEVLEEAIGTGLDIPKKKWARPECGCIMGNDIGAYNTCAHFCRYCYANYDKKAVRENMRRHDPQSPFLIGGPLPADRVTEAKQTSWIDDQIVMDISAAVSVDGHCDR